MARKRLFAIVYAVGIVVTIVLSNDATAIVLTPAVAVAVRKAKAEPLPYLLACAFTCRALVRTGGAFTDPPGWPRP